MTLIGFARAACSVLMVCVAATVIVGQQTENPPSSASQIPARHFGDKNAVPIRKADSVNDERFRTRLPDLKLPSAQPGGSFRPQNRSGAVKFEAPKTSQHVMGNNQGRNYQISRTASPGMQFESRRGATSQGWTNGRKPVTGRSIHQVDSGESVRRTSFVVAEGSTRQDEQNGQDVDVPSILGGQKQAPATNEKPSARKIQQPPAATQLPASAPAVQSAPANTAPQQAQPSAAAQQHTMKDAAPATTKTAQAVAQQTAGAAPKQALPQNTKTTKQAATAQKPIRKSEFIARANDLRSVPAISVSNKNTRSAATTPAAPLTAGAGVGTKGAAISSVGPALRVETIGPNTVGVGKTGTYQVQIRNFGQSVAKNILVGIDFPEWVDMENASMTTGENEATDGNSESRLIWTVDQVPAGGSQTMTLQLIPREASEFDMHVEWTMMPISGQTRVAVTQPELNVEINGPNEVRYGEKILYDVLISNPGTGTAENVSVLLPDELGGQKASLGNIEPNSDKRIQVELFAQTVGSLALTTTALGADDLNASDTREIIVRRAHLDVEIQGPGLKYTGTVANYKIMLSNSGDATASGVMAALPLPAGVTYLSGIESAEQVSGGLRWDIGTLETG